MYVLFVVFVAWKCILFRDLRVPFGGVQDSGVGREGGKLSIDFYSELKNICVQLDPPPPRSRL